MENFLEKTKVGIKERNKRLILDCIRSNPLIYRSTISTMLNLSKPTVSALVEELIDEGWVKEEDKDVQHLKVGRKPIRLIFNEQAGFVIGVDIGGSNVEVAVCDLSGHLIEQCVFNTQDYVNQSLLKKIQDTVFLILKNAEIGPEKVLGMGVGVPGIVNAETGMVIDAPSLNWINYPLKAEAEVIFGWDVHIDNDVNVSVLGEQWLGRAQNKENVVLLSIGTGIGCGILLNGKLYRGSNWGAGEAGFIITDKNKAETDYAKPFRGYGFLDSQVGGPALVTRMQENVNGVSAHPLQNKHAFTAKEIFDYAKEGDALATEVINEFISDLSVAIINIASILNPEIVLIGGGLSKSGDWFLDRLIEKVNIYTPFQTDIAIAKLGDQIGVLGAVTLFLEENESVLK
ncbi:ROK family transcriptional regulator [Lentibacillus saliphilus]|uniref:ROK family transcriptional regulator n=1 Tax=Lentibacillus saliphilus TaxID=2737028 RepID=UPI001C2F490E|nr:ROK family transcriptional regulator [Lentibacillus saliphilus]